MKVEFELECANGEVFAAAGRITIVGKEPENKPYVSIIKFTNHDTVFIKDKDLERFAVNILKSLKSKKLK